MGLDVSAAAFNSYAYFAGLLALKLLVMSVLTAINRFRKKVRQLKLMTVLLRISNDSDILLTLH